MITLTPAAVAKAKKMMAKQCPDHGQTGYGLRVGVVGGGCSGLSYNLKFDVERPDKGDTVLEFDGLKVFVDQISGTYLDGTEIDYVEEWKDGEFRVGFKFNNPNVKTQCGCGSSFST